MDWKSFYPEDAKFHFFWDGPFSQWHPSPFTVRGHVYDCAEQFMMASKAALFLDEKSFQKIMDAKRRPDIQKALGRKVKGFDQKVWETHRMMIVYRGTMAKFSQNPKLKAAMKEVHARGEFFVEASPYDKIWGIGLGQDYPGIENPAVWRGENLLGLALDEVAFDLFVKPYETASDKPIVKVVKQIVEVREPSGRRQGEDPPLSEYGLPGDWPVG